MYSRRRIWLASLAFGVGLASPAAALGAAGGAGLPLTGKSTGVASVDISTSPSPLTFSSSGQLSQLGAFTATGDYSFSPFGLPPVIPYTLTGTETLVAANGNELFGSVEGNGVNRAGATSGTNVVTITGGTGRFAAATGSFTETYTGQITSQVGTVLSGPIMTTIQGTISLGHGYCDPLGRSAGYCDPLERAARHSDHTGKPHRQRRHGRNRAREPGLR